GRRGEAAPCRRVADQLDAVGNRADDAAARPAVHRRRLERSALPPRPVRLLEARYRAARAHAQHDAGVGRRGAGDPAGRLDHHRRSDMAQASVSFGPDFGRLDPLPQVERALVLPNGTTWSEYDEPMISFPGSWDIDARLCLEACAPN